MRMIPIVLLSFALALASSCAKKEVLPIVVGAPGARGPSGLDGSDGSDGHSLVSQFVEACYFECNTGGTRLDVYLDLDDSVSVSEGDLYQGSLIACNGANGLNGEQGVPGEQGPQGEVGPQGEAGAAGEVGPTGPQGPQGEQGAQGPQGLQGIQGLPGATGAQGPAGSGATITIYNSSACQLIAGTSFYVKNNAIYSSATCPSNSKVVELNGSEDTFWVSASKIATENNGNGIRVITFN